MAPSKQAARKEQKKAAKATDDEPAPGQTGVNAVINAATQLFLGSVLVELSPVLATLMKADSTAASKDDNEEKKEGEEKKEKDVSAASVFEGLSTRLSFINTLGLEKAPEEAWMMFFGLAMDGGPYRRKKGNPKLERIMANLEQSMTQYAHILLALMCLHALTFRSYFACLPWLVGYQLLSLHFPLDVIRESFPQVPPVDFKFRVAITLGIHALVWLFFVFEAVYSINFLWKLLFIILFSVHAYVTVPDVNPEATKKAMSEKLAKQAAEAAPVAEDSNSGVSATIAMAKEVVMGSVLVKQGPALPDLVKGIIAAAKKVETTEQVDGDKLLGSLNDDLSLFNPLGLGVPASREEAKESWIKLKGLKPDFGFTGKPSSAIKERVLLSVSKNLPQYLHIFLAIMCLRSFFFRSFFACLPWLVGYQYLFLMLPVDMIKEKFPQVPPLALDAKARSLLIMVVHAFMCLFFVLEAAFRTYVLEKILLLGLFVAHALIMSSEAKSK